MNEESNEWMEAEQSDLLLNAKVGLSEALKDGGHCPWWMQYDRHGRLGYIDGIECDEDLGRLLSEARLPAGRRWAFLDVGGGEWVAQEVGGSLRNFKFLNSNIDYQKLNHRVLYGKDRLTEAKRRHDAAAAELAAHGDEVGDVAEVAEVAVMCDDAMAAAALDALWNGGGNSPELWFVGCRHCEELGKALLDAHISRVLVFERDEVVAERLELAGLEVGIIPWNTDRLRVYDMLTNAPESECRQAWDRLSDVLYKSARELESSGNEESHSLASVREAFERRPKPEPIPSGFGQLDEVLGGGFSPGRLYVLAAAPSVGKTMVALQAMTQAAAAGFKVAYFGTEMSSAELYARMVSREAHRMGCTSCGSPNAYECAAKEGNWGSLSMFQAGDYSGRNISQVLGHGVTENELLRGSLPKDKQAMAAAAAESLGGIKGTMRFYEPKGIPMSTEFIRGKVAKLARSLGGGWFVITDYLQMLATSDGRQTDSQRATEIVLSLKALAREQRAAVLAISSTSRANYGSQGMGNSKESGNIEYAADLICNLNLEGVVNGEKANSKESETAAYKRKDEASRKLDRMTHGRVLVLDIAKNRSGRTSDKIRFLQWPQFSDMMELPPTSAE